MINQELISQISQKVYLKKSVRIIYKCAKYGFNYSYIKQIQKCILVAAASLLHAMHQNHLAD